MVMVTGICTRFDRWAASGAKEKCGEVVAVGVRIAGEIIIEKRKK